MMIGLNPGPRARTVKPGPRHLRTRPGIQSGLLLLVAVLLAVELKYNGH